MSSRDKFGWNESLEDSLSSLKIKKPSRPARVIMTQLRELTVHDGSSEILVQPRGRWYFGDREQVPAVGDWLMLTHAGNEPLCLIPRMNVLKRITKGERVPQTIAANVDVLFIVTSCNEEFNESRVERYLALAELSKVDRHIVLTKKDLCADSEGYLERTRVLAFSTKTSLVNSHKPEDLLPLTYALRSSKTGLFVGSSGVGKSTIINTLLGGQVQKTAAVRARDQRGRHTTTARALFQLPAGGLAIDVPGTREIALLGEASHFPQTFPDIEKHLQNCKFSNCSHNSESGCAIREALESGTLEDRRWQNYNRLLAQVSAPSFREGPRRKQRIREDDVSADDEGY